MLRQYSVVLGTHWWLGQSWSCFHGATSPVGMKDCQTVITQSSQGHDFGRSTGLGVGIEKEGLVEFHRKEDILEKLSRKQYSWLFNNTGVGGSDYPRSGKSFFNLSQPSAYTDSKPQIEKGIYVMLREKSVPNLDQHVQMSRDEWIWGILGSRNSLCVHLRSSGLWLKENFPVAHGALWAGRGVGLRPESIGNQERN